MQYVDSSRIALARSFNHYLSERSNAPATICVFALNQANNIKIVRYTKVLAHKLQQRSARKPTIALLRKRTQAFLANPVAAPLVTKTRTPATTALRARATLAKRNRARTCNNNNPVAAGQRRRVRSIDVACYKRIV